MSASHQIDRRAKLLFFFAYGHRSGSEVALYEYIRHADRHDIHMGVACWQDGPLIKAFPPDVTTFNYRKDPSLSDEESIRRIHDEFRPAAWYINTIVQPRIMRLARTLNVPCILHTHELEEPLEVLSPDDLEILTSYPDLIIATSQGAAEVMRVLGRERSIEVCNAPIDIGRIKSTPERALEIRQQIGVGADHFLWVMSGTHNQRKDPSLFVEVASRTTKETDRARFLWVGETRNAYSIFVKEKARRLGLTGKLSWIPPQTEHYYDYLNAADGFVMTSRSESLGLVLLEAAALGKPIVSFDSPGPREILRPGMGLLAERSDTAGLVSAMTKVMRGEVSFDPAVSRRRAADFDISNQGQRWQSFVQDYLTRGARELPSIGSVRR